MTFDPTLIALRFEDVIVQKEPAAPVYCEHSFVTRSSPLRGEEPVFAAELAPATAPVTTMARSNAKIALSSNLVGRGCSLVMSSLLWLSIAVRACRPTPS